MTYMQCGMACRRECGKYLMSYLGEECNECVPGCHCEPGLLYHDGKCMEPTDCPCVYNGNEYKQGHVIDTVDTCQSCECGLFGHWSCNQTDCLTSCEVLGHGILRTFDGEQFVLGLSREITCAYELVISQVGSSEGTFVLEIDSGTILTEDLSTGTTLSLPHQNDRFYFKEVAAGSVVVDMEDFRVVLYADGFVRIDADSGNFYNSLKGLCGNLNFKKADDRMQQTGVLAESDSEFIEAYSYNPSNFLQRCGMERDVTPAVVDYSICLELELLYTQRSQSGVAEFFQMCQADSTPENVCPLLLRLADRLKTNLYMLVKKDGHPHLHKACVEC
nr:hypothetical protein BaRGS_005725 [Batillaria attramentaria]